MIDSLFVWVVRKIIQLSFSKLFFSFSSEFFIICLLFSPFFKIYFFSLSSLALVLSTIYDFPPLIFPFPLSFEWKYFSLAAGKHFYKLGRKELIEIVKVQIPWTHHASFTVEFLLMHESIITTNKESFRNLMLLRIKKVRF